MHVVAVTSIIAVVSIVQGIDDYVSDAIVSELGLGTFNVQRWGMIRSDRHGRGIGAQLLRARRERVHSHLGPRLPVCSEGLQGQSLEHAHAQGLSGALHELADEGQGDDAPAVDQHVEVAVEVLVGIVIDGEGERATQGDGGSAGMTDARYSPHLLCLCACICCA